MVNQLCREGWDNRQWVRERCGELAGIRALKGFLPARHAPLKIRIFELQRQIENETNKKSKENQIMKTPKILLGIKRNIDNAMQVLDRAKKQRFLRAALSSWKT